MRSVRVNFFHLRRTAAGAGCLPAFPASPAVPAWPACSQSGLWRLDRFPRHDAGPLRLAAKDLAALRDIQPRAVGAAERDAADRRRVELGLVQNVRAASRLLADLNAHGARRPHVADRID